MNHLVYTSTVISVIWLVLLTEVLKKLHARTYYDTSEQYEMDPTRYDPDDRQPSRINSSCAVLTRLVLGGAWLALLNDTDVICPPQYAEACYLIFTNVFEPRDEAHKRCLKYGLTLWLPWSTAEEMAVRDIMTSLKVEKLVMGIKANGSYWMEDMEGFPITHDNFEDLPYFDEHSCFYLYQNNPYWVIGKCTKLASVFCTIY